MVAIGGFRSDLSITRKTEGIRFVFQRPISIVIQLVTLNRRMRLARHIGFVIYFKIAQTYILRYYSTHCKTNGKEK